MRVVFMGSSAFATPALAAVADAGHVVVAVYTQAPRPAGRGQSERPTPVHALAATRGWPVRTPSSLKPTEERDAFAAWRADVALVAAYGLILPQSVLDAPTHGCLNLHGSLLPRWRGAAPIQRAIEAGDAVTGVQLMRMETGLDTGPVALERRTRIDETETAQELHDRLAALGADLAVEGLAALAEGALAFTPQSGEPTYAAKIDKSESRIDWTRDGAAIARKINAFSPFPGAWFEHAGQRVKALRARPADGDGAPGQILQANDRLVAAAGRGAIELLELQKAGGKRLPAQEFLRGFPLSPDRRLA